MTSRSRSVKQTRGTRGSGNSDALGTAMSRAVSDARDLGHELAAAGVAISKTTARLVYDVGAVVNLAGWRAVGGAVAAAQDAVQGARSYVSALGSEHVPRKPLARAARGAARRTRAETAQA